MSIATVPQRRNSRAVSEAQSFGAAFSQADAAFAALVRAVGRLEPSVRSLAWQECWDLLGAQLDLLQEADGIHDEVEAVTRIMVAAEALA